MGLSVCNVLAGDDRGEKRSQIEHLKYTLLIFLQSRCGKSQFEASLVCLLDESPRTQDELHLIEHRLEKIVVVFHHLRKRESRTRVVFKQLGGTDFLQCAFEEGNFFGGQIATRVKRRLSKGFFVQWFGIDNHTVRIKKNIGA